MDIATRSHRSFDRHRLRAIREDRGLTREQLAVAAGLAVRTLAGIERGEANPHRATVAALERALDVDLLAAAEAPPILARAA